MTDNETTNKRCIVHIIGHIQGGGVEHIVAQYLNELIPSEKYKYAVIAYDDPDTQYQQLIRKGLLFYKIPSFKHWKKYDTELSAILKELSCDIVHCHLGSLACFPLFVAKKSKVPIRIVHNHSSGTIHEPARTFCKYLLKPFAIKFATHYCACSLYAAHWFFGKEKANSVKVIYNCINVDKFRHDLEARTYWRNHYGFAQSFVFGFVGRLGKQKNPSFLISFLKEAKKVIPNAKLMIVGDGPLNNRLQAMVKDFDLMEDVKFLGNRDDVCALYQAMDVFLLPSLYEGLPIVGVEAQTAGLPCIFSDKITEEIILTDAAVRLPIKNSVAKWIDYCRNHYIHMDRCENATKIRTLGFDIKHEGKRLEEYYSNILARI